MRGISLPCVAGSCIRRMTVYNTIEKTQTKKNYKKHKKLNVQKSLLQIKISAGR